MFMTSRFELRHGTLDRFETAMARVVPAMVDQGWRLVGAFRNVTGDVSQATHVWEIPDADSLSTAPGRAVAADASLLEDVAVLGEIITREELTFLAPLSYDVGSRR
jgi:hypothetical protein